MTCVTVTVGGAEYVVSGERRFTFGRGPDCDAQLDAADGGISRLAGSIELDDGKCWLVNRSRTRSLIVVDETRIPKVVAKGQRHALSGPVTVLVDGSRGRHTLTLDAPPFKPGDAEENADAAGIPTSMGVGVRFNDPDKRALVALFHGYLADPPRYDPYPKKYDAAAARLGCRRTTLVKRIEYLRTRLTNAGVPNLHGPTALSNLAEYVIAAGIITKDDLALLDLPCPDLP